MRILTAAVLLMLPAMATAQEPPPHPPARALLRITGGYADLTPEDRERYCFWAGQLYSIGASFCSRQQTFATCTEVSGHRPVWVNKENDKFCDRNTSPTPD